MKQLFNCPQEKISCLSITMFAVSMLLFLYFLASVYFLLAGPSEDNPLIPCSFLPHHSCADLAMSMTWGSLTLGAVVLIISLLTNPSPYKNSNPSES